MCTYASAVTTTAKDPPPPPLAHVPHQPTHLCPALLMAPRASTSEAGSSSTLVASSLPATRLRQRRGAGGQQSVSGGRASKGEAASHDMHQVIQVMFSAAASSRLCPEGLAMLLANHATFTHPASITPQNPLPNPPGASPAWVCVQYPQQACLWVPAAPQQAYHLTPAQVHMDVHQQHGLTTHNTREVGGSSDCSTCLPKTVCWQHTVS